MKLALSYEEIVKKFNSDLVNKLRKHGSENNYLNLWVPDENFLRSFESLSESIKSSKINSFTLKVKKNFFDKVTLSQFKKKFPDTISIENKNYYLISVKDINVLNLNKKIIDKVNSKEQKKVKYSYGSLSSQKNKSKVRRFFLDFYNKKYESEMKSIKFNKKIMSFLFTIDEQDICLDFNKKNEFLKFRTDIKNKYILGCLFFFNQIFYKRKLNYIATNGISEFIMKVNQRCKNKINGIILPFNFGYEVFFVNSLCQMIFKKFADSNFKPTYNKFWLQKTLNEKINLCKLALKKFHKNINEAPNSIIFNSIQEDINKMPIRIIVSTSQLVDRKHKPNLLRKFEKFIKKEIDESLQVLHEEKKDLNKIRRL